METTMRGAGSARVALTLMVAAVLAISLLAHQTATAPAADARPLGGGTHVLVGMACYGEVEWVQIDGPASAVIHDRHAISTVVELPAPGLYSFLFSCNGVDQTHYLYESGWSPKFVEAEQNLEWPPPCEVCNTIFVDPQGQLVDILGDIGQPVEWDDVIDLGSGLLPNDHIEFDALSDLAAQGLLANGVMTFDAEQVIAMSFAVIDH